MYSKILQHFRSPKWIPMRVIICIMMFTACWMNYMCRLQMSVLAVPMIKTQEDSQSNASTACETSSFFSLESVNSTIINYTDSYSEVSLLPKFEYRKPGFKLFSGEPFDWTPFIRGQLISAYSWGNVPGNFIGGLLSQKYGARNSILCSSIIAAVISLLTPLIAQVSWVLLAISRVIIGITGGVTFPACHNLVAKWAPPDEKGRFIWTLQGGTLGSIFLFGLISGIAENINWESGWYIPAIFMMIWISFWWLFSYDSPDEHPGITESEKKYIIESQGENVNKNKISFDEIPLLKILTSIPFICLLMCHFGNMFLLYFYQNAMMLFQTKVLGFKLTKGGIVSGLPWANRVFFAFLFSYAGDVIKRKQIISVTKLRKIATIFSHFLPGICLIIVGYLGCSFFWANAFLILALGFNGAAALSNLSNNQDLSPNFAGFLYGIMNTVAGLSGIIISPMVEEIAGKYGHPIEKWRLLFWIGACVCIFCMIIFVIGGSGKVQSWNQLEQRQSVESEANAGRSSQRETTVNIQAVDTKPK